MPILEPDELDDLQAEVAEVYAETMPDLLFIQRTTESGRDPENPEIIVSDTVNKIYDDVPCEYRQATPRERQVVVQTDKSQVLVIEMAAVYDIRESDSGQIYAKGETPAIDFEVIGVARESNATDLTLYAEVVSQ